MQTYLPQAFVNEITKDYMDEFDLPVPYKNGASLNGVLYMGTYLTILRRVFKVNILPNDRVAIGKAMLACMQEPDHPGLLFRNPKNRDQEGPDDYFGVGMVALALGTQVIPQAIVNYWKDHAGWMNNEVPGTRLTRSGKTNWSAFMPRFPALYGFLHYAAHGSWSILGGITMWLSLVLPLPQGNETSDDHMDWGKVMWLQDQWGFKWACKRWWARINSKKRYPYGIASCFAEYFGMQHPFTKAVAIHYGKATMNDKGEIEWLT